ncbi:MAG TPA: OsmC family protein [Chthoniobacterales bacterium]|nr:OsmC family protein [Chthoniobacterales bacterium]
MPPANLFGSDKDMNTKPPPDVVVTGTARDFFQQIVTGKHQLVADEPADVDLGTDKGPSPYDYLLAALGTCTSMTIGWQARKRKIPLEGIKVSLWQSRVHAKDCEDCLTKEGMIHQIDLDIELRGNFTPEQRRILMQAAERCPVHRTLTSEIKIRTRDVGAPLPPQS